METFINPKNLVSNPHFQEQRQKCLAGLNDGMIDAPIVDLINGYNKIPCFFTLQCCYGHFLYKGQQNPNNFARLPISNTVAQVEYRMAYIAFCIDDNDLGKQLLKDLKTTTTIDSKNIQFGCSDWFWKRQVNSYVLQVEPDRFKHEDKAIIGYKEALNIEKIRNKFFVQLKELLRKQE